MLKFLTKSNHRVMQGLGSYRRAWEMLNGLFSLNSLAVGVAHNISSEYVETQTPDPQLERFRGHFIVKPFCLVFILVFGFVFSGKTNGFFIFLCFSIHFRFGSALERKHSKTSAFFTFLNENTVKPMLFHLVERKQCKTNAFFPKQLGCKGSS